MSFWKKGQKRANLGYSDKHYQENQHSSQSSAVEDPNDISDNSSQGEQSPEEYEPTVSESGDALSGGVENVINPKELQILKSEIQSRFDVQPNMKLPVLVEYSLSAMSDQTAAGCNNLQNDVEELYILSEEIVRKSDECNQLISKLNENTAKVSKKLGSTHQSINQVKLPRRSILQTLMLIVLWFFTLIVKCINQIRSKVFGTKIQNDRKVRRKKGKESR